MKHNLADTIKQMQARKAPAHRREPKQQAIRPTPEREAKAPTRSAGMARRIIPVIDRLLKHSLINQKEYDSLSYYRDQASLSDKSSVRSCIDFSPKGGNGPGVSIMSASIETDRIEKALGPYRAMLRAVAVDDVSLEQWCVESGSKLSADQAAECVSAERLPHILQAIHAGLNVPHPADVAAATLDLKDAAERITDIRA